MDNTQEKLVKLITLVADNAVSRVDEKLMLLLCLSEIASFSDDVTIQSAVETMEAIAKGE